jgi:selenocysteine lyase/cysteine desulfurase
MYTPSGTKSTIVSFYEKRATEVAAKLMTQKIKVTGREAHGGHIRVAPHFYNTTDEIDTCFERYETILS